MMPHRLVGLILSLGLHALLGWLLLRFAYSVPPDETSSASLELWSAPAAVVPRPILPAATPIESPTPPAQAKAQIQLSQKKVPLNPLPNPKPAEKAPKSIVPPSAVLAKPKEKKPVLRHDADELLADLEKPAATHAVPSIVPGTASKDSASAVRSQYALQVQQRVRPLVETPPDMQGHPKAVVQVLLWPTLEVRSVTLLQSSGNRAYDESVQRAIWSAKTFPPLPVGAAFSDYRQLRLEFKPQ